MEVSRHALGELSIIVVQLKDRRQSRAPEEHWLFQHTLQHALYGGTSSGIHRLYECASLTQAPLALSVEDKRWRGVMHVSRAAAAHFATVGDVAVRIAGQSAERHSRGKEPGPCALSEAG